MDKLLALPSLKDADLVDRFPHGRVGLILISVDHSTDFELRRILGPDFGIFVNRVLFKAPLTMENLKATHKEVQRAATELLNGYEMNVLIYGCTSGAMSIGLNTLHDTLTTARPGAMPTDPMTAAIAAFRHLKANKIVLLTPYPDDVTVGIAKAFKAQGGIEVLIFGGLGQTQDYDTTMVTYEKWAQSAQLLVEKCPSKPDALFLSCTSTTIVNKIADLEQLIGLPVVTSNQALAWHTKLLLEQNFQKSIPDVKGFGQLFDQ